MFDLVNKIYVNYALDLVNSRLKYRYAHKGLTMFEPTYDVAKNSWKTFFFRRVYGDDLFETIWKQSHLI